MEKKKIGGRRSLPEDQRRVTFTCRVSPETAMRIRELRDQKVSIGRALDGMVDALHKKK